MTCRARLTGLAWIGYLALLVPVAVVASAVDKRRAKP